MSRVEEVKKEMQDKLTASLKKQMPEATDETINMWVEKLMGCITVEENKDGGK